MANVDTIAQSFIQFYYATFDSNRAGLSAVYQAGSMFTYMDAKMQGAQAIMEHLTKLNLGNVAHKISTMDAQPTPNGILVFVTGNMHLGDPNPLYFSEVFNLLPTDASGSNFYVQNQLFRLNYG